MARLKTSHLPRQFYMLNFQKINRKLIAASKYICIFATLKHLCGTNVCRIKAGALYLKTKLELIMVVIASGNGNVPVALHRWP